MEIDLPRLVGLLASATLAGSMLFFSCVVAPLVFARLEPATAGAFIRALFPWYYAVVAALSLLAALALIGTPVDAGIMAAILAGALVSRQLLMPRINRHRDRGLAGDAGSGAAFRRLHRLSVAINSLQLVGAFVVLIRLGLPGA